MNSATCPTAVSALSCVLFAQEPGVIKESKERTSPLFILMVLPRVIERIKLKWLLLTTVTGPEFNRNSL